jgi:hypothetical protein
LLPGYQYQFNYDLKYTDKDGNTKSYFKDTHDFYTVKTGPSVVIEDISLDNEKESAKVKVTITDPEATRSTNVSYTIKDSTGTMIQSGDYDSNVEVFTLNNLNPLETYTITVQFNYKLSYDKPTQTSITTQTFTTSNTSVSESEMSL